jgi:hypothetical protein
MLRGIYSQHCIPTAAKYLFLSVANSGRGRIHGLSIAKGYFFYGGGAQLCSISIPACAELSLGRMAYTEYIQNK